MKDVDSDAEYHDAAKRLYSELLGGGGESDCEEIEDTEGDLLIRRQAMKKYTLDECKAMLGREKEVERANAPGRTKEADAQMKRHALAFQSVLHKDLPTTWISMSSCNFRLLQPWVLQPQVFVTLGSHNLWKMAALGFCNLRFCNLRFLQPWFL